MGERGQLDGKATREDGPEKQLNVVGTVGGLQGVEKEAEEMITVMPPGTFQSGTIAERRSDWSVQKITENVDDRYFLEICCKAIEQVIGMR